MILGRSEAYNMQQSNTSKMITSDDSNSNHNRLSLNCNYMGVQQQTTNRLSKSQSSQFLPQQSMGGGGDSTSMSPQLEPHDEIYSEDDSSGAIIGSSNGKSHPVMGIFFKVWSLVKVTKVRREQNKIKRQNSEDANQFRYISGDQLAADQSVNRYSQSRQTLLNDSHFRRAGSQPAPTISNSIESTGGVGGGGNCMAKLQPTIATTTTNTSTSSGVSSTTSSTLADNQSPNNHANNSTATSSFSAIRRQAMAAYNARRHPETGNQPVKWNKSGGKQAETRLASSSSSGNFAAWTSRIRRSATSVNQTESVKYRAQTPLVVNRLSSTADDLDERLRNRLSMQQQQQQQQQYRRHASEPLSDGDSQIEDEDEIYSTPNDSIQSVPSSAPIAATTNASFQVGHVQAHHQPASIVGHVHPITKSFSTSNFSQLLTHKELIANSSQPLIANEKFKQINESSSNNLFHKQDSNSEQTNQSKQFVARRLTNGSRFFISSSSSEDSNSPSSQQMAKQQQLQQQQQQQQQHQQLHQFVQPPPTTNNEDNQSLANNHVISNQQLELHHGVHYHHQTNRPNYLPIIPQQFVPATATTILSPILPNGFQPIAITAVSPGPAAIMGNGFPAIISTNYNSGYKKSPSLFEISNTRRFSSKYPLAARTNKPAPMPPVVPSIESQTNNNNDNNEEPAKATRIPNSISLNDCKSVSDKSHDNQFDTPVDKSCYSEYKLTQMLLEMGANPAAKDQGGFTALMHAVLSDNLPAVKCLVEHGVDVNDTNDAGLSAIDLICSRSPTDERLEMLKYLINNQSDLDRVRPSDGSRLLDRLIEAHQSNGHSDSKLVYIECLLQNGSKMGSKTWLAASGKFDIQLRLLRKLCQDGYFLYKKSSIEAAIYRFEYALKRLAALEQQLSGSKDNYLVNYTPPILSGNFWLLSNGDSDNNYLMRSSTRALARQIKYQTYLGLSRCERKRKFYKRALEFAHLAILVDSKSYEGFYSKAHILKDLGEYDESLFAIDQTARLVDKSIDVLQIKLDELQQQEGESLILDRYFNETAGNFDTLTGNHVGANLFNRTSNSNVMKLEVTNNLEYLVEAKRHIAKLKQDILADKMASSELVAPEAGSRSRLDSGQESFTSLMAS